MDGIGPPRLVASFRVNVRSDDSEDIFWPIRLDPQPQRLIVPVLTRKQIWPKFLFVSLPENIWLKVAGTCKPLNVVSVALDVSFQFREGQVVRFQSKEFDSLPETRKQWPQTFFIRLRCCCNADRIEIDTMTSVQLGPFACKLYDLSQQRVGDQVDDVAITCRPPDTVSMDDGEAAKQCRETDSVANSSISRKNEFQGSGGPSLIDIGQLFRGQARQEVPMLCHCRAMRS
jgi:hypothetical protein